jgi:hypothetical protein
MLKLLISESASDQQVGESLHGFVHRVQRYAYRLNIPEFDYDEEKLAACHKLAVTLLHHYFNPSCFKAAAALTIATCATRPFSTQLPQQFKELVSFPNAVFAILESVYGMHGAELLVAADDVRTLTNPIEFSDHFFREFSVTNGRIGALIEPIAGNNIPEEYRVTLRNLALTYEALAYQHNKTCRYPPPDALQIEKYFTILG